MTQIIFCQEPALAVAAELSNSYKNGAVGIMGSPNSVLQRQIIKDGGTTECGTQFGEHIRCIVGIGSYRHIRAAREASVGKRLYLLPDIVDDICFARYSQNRYLKMQLEAPEAVFYAPSFGGQIRASAYASLLKLLVKCADALAIYPCSSQLLSLALQVGKMLDSPLDGCSCTRLVADACDIFTLANNGIIQYQPLLLDLCDLTADTVFFTNYLIMATLIQFTKLDFNGIFIGKERSFLNTIGQTRSTEDKAINSQRVKDGIKQVLGGTERLQRYAQRYLWESGLQGLQTPCAGKLLHIIAQAEDHIKDAGMLGILCRAGIIDKIK